jgi:hypothetical protein
MFFVFPCRGDTVIVDQNGLQDFNTIQEAIDDSNNSDEIKVAAGTYPEAINFNGKAIRLYSSNGPEVTIIDAKLKSPVVTCNNGEDSNTILEGFTITGGNAVNSEPMGCGGGMRNFNNSNPTVINCRFTDNMAADGGGMFNQESNPTVINCIFNSNWALAAAGAGMLNDFSSPKVTNCTFSGNIACRDGGGMGNFDNSNPTVIDCNFSGNQAEAGGGIYNRFHCSPTVINCTFKNNMACGMCNKLNSSPTVINCTFIGNIYSGMSNFSQSNPTVKNCRFIGNIEGGGISNGHWSNPIVTNCTFSENIGGGIYNGNESKPTVTNCILWGDTPNEIYDYTSDSVVIYSNVQGGWPGDGNIDTDPCFVDTPEYNLRLKMNSPCIDAGDPNYSDMNYPSDLDGRDRFVDGDCNNTKIIDMGAYEFTSAYYGDFNGNCAVDFIDYGILAGYWLTDELSVDVAPTPAGDGIIDEQDLAIICDNWLAGK